MPSSRVARRLVASLCFAGSLVLLPSTAATAAGGTVPGDWSVATVNSTQPVATPSGDILVGGVCSAANLSEYSASGTAAWSLPSTSSTSCDAHYLIADADGTTYLQGYPDSLNVSAIGADGQVRWTTDTSGWSPGRARPALGWDGRVYFDGFNGRSSAVLGFDRSTGALAVTLPFSDVSGLFTYAGGLIVVDGPTSNVDYYDYSGTLQAQYNTAIASNGFYSVSGGNGTVFVSGWNENCQKVVQKFTPSGLAWTWTASDVQTVCSGSQTFVTATTDGGVIVSGYDVEDAGAPYISLDGSGELRWSHVPVPSNDELAAGRFWALPIVDANGVVALPSALDYTTGCSQRLCYDVQVEFLSQATGSTVIEPLVISGAADGGWTESAMALTPGHLYLALNCGDYNAAATNGMGAFEVTGLGEDYQVAIGTPPGSSVTPPGVNSPALDANPSTQSVGKRVALTATNFPPNALVRFGVTSGPDQASFSAFIRTDRLGTAATTIRGRNGAGTDTVAAWLDGNDNGVLDAGESSATTDVTWKPTIYVALGDSYSSGEGNPPFLAPTDTRSDQCHRSALGYPMRVANALGFYRSNFSFHACSGAVISDYYNRNAGNNEVAQDRWLTTSDALVTLTMGGNNLDFSHILRYCITHGLLQGGHGTPCKNYQDSRIRRALANVTTPGVNGLSQLQSLYHNIRLRAPSAKVLVLGYPQFFVENPTRACQEITIGDQRWINSVIDEFDNAIKSAAFSQGVSYVDVENVLQPNSDNGYSHHEECSATPWMNGVVPRHLVYSFHPNAGAHAAEAARVETVYNTL